MRTKLTTAYDERAVLTTAIRRCDVEIAHARARGHDDTAASLEVQRAVLLGNLERLGQGEDVKEN